MSLNNVQGGLIGQGISTGGNIVSTLAANAANRELFHENLEWQEKMMDKQNAYNSPSAQLQRMREAGLNPNLIYGSQGDNGNMSPVNPTSQPTMQAPRVFDGLGQMISTSMNANDLATSQIQYQQQLLEQSKKAVESIEVQIQKMSQEVKQMTLQYGLDQIKVAIEKGFYGSAQGSSAYRQFLFDQTQELSRAFGIKSQEVLLSAYKIMADVGYTKALTQTENETRELKKGQYRADIQLKVDTALLNRAKKGLTDAQTQTEDLLREPRHIQLQQTSRKVSLEGDKQVYENMILRPKAHILGNEKTQAGLMLVDGLLSIGKMIVPLAK